MKYNIRLLIFVIIIILFIIFRYYHEKKKIDSINEEYLKNKQYELIKEGFYNV